MKLSELIAVANTKVKKGEVLNLVAIKSKAYKPSKVYNSVFPRVFNGNVAVCGADAADVIRLPADLEVTVDALTSVIEAADSEFTYHIILQKITYLSFDL